jgi:predicted cupin superfamily sugar epimerase
MEQEAFDLITALALVPHPEGGFYRETFRSPATVENAEGALRSASTAIYFLLPAGAFSAWHRVTSDEVWHHYAGDPLDVHQLDERGHRVARVGPDVLTGQVPQLVVPAGTYQAAITVGTRFALCGCTVAPGFDFADFTMPTRSELCAAFPHARDVIEALTRR